MTNLAIIPALPRAIIPASCRRLGEKQEKLSLGIEKLSPGIEKLSLGIEKLSLGIENLSPGITQHYVTKGRRLRP